MIYFSQNGSSKGAPFNRLWPWRRPSTKKVHVRSPTSAWRTCDGSGGSGTGRSVSFRQAAHSQSLTHSLTRPARYTASSRRLLKKLRTAQVVKTSPQFTDSNSSLPSSQQPPLVSTLRALQYYSFEILCSITLPSISRSSKCFLLPHHKPPCTVRPSTTLYNLTN